MSNLEPSIELSPTREILICDDTECGSSLVFPMGWVKEDSEHWALFLKCPECESETEEIFSEGEVWQLSDKMERVADLMLKNLVKLTKANMQAEADLLARALDEDLITADDFAPR